MSKVVANLPMDTPEDIREIAESIREKAMSLRYDIEMTMVKLRLRLRKGLEAEGIPPYAIEQRIMTNLLHAAESQRNSATAAVAFARDFERLYVEEIRNHRAGRSSQSGAIKVN